jgi:uncharacterized protein DUF1501
MKCPGHVTGVLTRRQMLAASANGFGLFALSALMADRAYSGAARQPAPHFPPKAKNVILLFMDGGVSHIDSFDPKPELERRDGETYQGTRKWLRSPWRFRRYGQSGLPVSELFPHIATCADDLAAIRSMRGGLPLHPSGVLLLHTGREIAGSPSLGSWVTYGLGSENRNLPGFVVLNHDVVPCGGMENFAGGYLPAAYQATVLRAEGRPIDNIVPAANRPAQRAMLDLLAHTDQRFSAALGADDAVESAIRNYELAYRMQSLVPDVLDLSRETEATRRLYGIDATDAPKRLYGIQCLRARRMIEAGVRFIEVCCPNLYNSNGTWDQHGGLKQGHERNAFVTDQAIAGLLKDLKSRGLLDETLVIWAGEFGRTPHAPGRDGRDHHPEGFTVWLAGGGIRGGIIHGATDELGMHAAVDITTFHDLHATMLHLLGLDHERLTYRFGGRDFRLTDVHGHVIREILS